MRNERRTDNHKLFSRFILRYRISRRSYSSYRTELQNSKQSRLASLPHTTLVNLAMADNVADDGRTSHLAAFTISCPALRNQNRNLVLHFQASISSDSNSLQHYQSAQELHSMAGSSSHSATGLVGVT